MISPNSGSAQESRKCFEVSESVAGRIGEGKPKVLTARTAGELLPCSEIHLGEFQ